MLTRFQILVAIACTGCSLASRLAGPRSPGSQPAAAPGDRPGSATSVATAPAATDDCPSYESIDGLDPVITLLRCPETRYRTSGSDADTLGGARAKIRAYLDTGLEEDARQLPRAAYVHLCALQMKVETRLYPAMAIGCAWHADVLDRNALAGELGAFPAGARANITNQVARAVDTVHARTVAAFPKAGAAREWQLFYDLPMRLRDEARARRKSHAKAFQMLVAFDRAIQRGSWDRCEASLKDGLTSYLRGEQTLASATQRMTDPVGYALAEALARCHYYNERELKAGALVAIFDHARRQVTLAEQIKYAQVDALAIDAEKAEKFPNLVGSRYSAVKPGDLTLDPRRPDELDDKWRFQKADLVAFQTREGRVASVDKTAAGAVIHFKKERVPLVDLKCRETNRIDRIDPDGKITYRQDCTSTPKGEVWSTPEPITVDEAAGVAAGRYVRIAVRGDKGVVLSCAANPGAAARVDRLADLVLGAE